MKKLICSVLIVLIVFLSFPFCAAASVVSSIYSVGDSGTNLVNPYNLDGSTAQITEHGLYFNCTDNRGDWYYQTMFGTGARVDLTNVDSIVVHFSDVTMTVRMSICVGITYLRTEHIASNSGFYVYDNQNTSFDVTLDVSDYTGNYFIDFGFLSYPDGVEDNKWGGSCSGYITSITLNNSSSDSGDTSVVIDLTGTNNRLDSIKSVVDDVADDVSTIKSNFTTLLTDIGVIKTSTSSAASDVGTVKSDLSTTKGYIDTIKSDVAAIKTAFNSFVSSDISTIKSGISSINSDLNTKLTAVITALGDVQTAVAAVPTGINSRLDTVNQNLVYIYQALVKQYTGLNDYSTVYQEFVVTQGRLETIAYKIEAFQDLFGNFAGIVFSPFIDPEEEKLSIYDNMVAAFSDNFETLYNVILYGDKNGAEAQQLEQMKMKQFQADLDSITARLDDAPSAINSNAADVSAEISVFTQFYEGITALNAALSSVLYFGLIVIFIKKVVGR